MDATTTPNNPPTTVQANLFKEAQAEEDAAETRRAHDNRVDLLITAKGHQRLRAFGFEVVQLSDKALGASTTDRRSL